MPNRAPPPYFFRQSSLPNDPAPMHHWGGGHGIMRLSRQWSSGYESHHRGLIPLGHHGHPSSHGFGRHGRFFHPYHVPTRLPNPIRNFAPGGYPRLSGNDNLQRFFNPIDRNVPGGFPAPTRHNLPSRFSNTNGHYGPIRSNHFSNHRGSSTTTRNNLSNEVHAQNEISNRQNAHITQRVGIGRHNQMNTQISDHRSRSFIPWKDQLGGKHQKRSSKESKLVNNFEVSGHSLYLDQPMNYEEESVTAQLDDDTLRNVGAPAFNYGYGGFPIPSLPENEDIEYHEEVKTTLNHQFTDVLNMEKDTEQWRPSKVVSIPWIFRLAKSSSTAHYQLTVDFKPLVPVASGFIATVRPTIGTKKLSISKFEYFGDKGNSATVFEMTFREEEIEKYLDDGHLFVKLKVCVKSGNDLRERLEFNKSEDRDTCVIVEDQRFYVSKRELASFSPVFDRMFFGGFEESKKSEITLKGIFASDFHDFLVFCVNGGRLENDTVRGIADIAEMYDIEAVRLMCINFISQNQTYSTIEKRQFGEEFGIPELKNYVRQQ
ncbi:hypothetical protein L5515_019653 [Caenorhabditis briggsae]|uniref:BTB domain-containing protein n=1 Tax=Caenorhabditis briggsae TaxID=6238 RepID=A0AAE9FMC9_CAEBR|nr:hypothetical protein L5515_019653 [Caenorhabditis briggsae]